VLVWFSSCRVLGCELDLHLGGGLGGMARHVWTSRFTPGLRPERDGTSCVDKQADAHVSDFLYRKVEKRKQNS